MQPRVAYEIKAGVAHVRLTRPDRLNAIDAQQLSELVAVGARLSDEKILRAVVLSGEGRAFCSGIDVSAFAESAPRARRPQQIDIGKPTHGAANIAQHAVLQWRSLPVPVIAAIHGYALGGGLQLPLGADIRIVHPATKLGLIEAKWGLVPDMGGMLLLRELLRRDQLADLMYSARIFDGTEAHALGLATRLSGDPLASAMDLAQEIATTSPSAIRAGKRLLNICTDASSALILTAEADEQRRLLLGANHAEAVAAASAKRAAVFRDDAEH